MLLESRVVRILNARPASRGRVNRTVHRKAWNKELALSRLPRRLVFIKQFLPEDETERQQEPSKLCLPAGGQNWSGISGATTFSRAC